MIIKTNGAKVRRKKAAIGSQLSLIF